MRISNFSNFNAVSFGTNTRRYKVGPENDVVYTQTKINREDIDFKNLVVLIFGSFKDKDKVSVYDMACSDGSEAYTLAIFLKEFLKDKKVAKFFPIIASDSDGIIITCAKRNKINITEDELKELEKAGIDYKKYFLPAKEKMYIPNDKISNDTETYMCCDELKKNIRFENCTILQQIEKMEKDEPKVVLCRNVLPYLGNRSDVLYNLLRLNNKMKQDDILVIGDFDRDFYIIDFLKKRDFKEIQNNVFVKTK